MLEGKILQINELGRKDIGLMFKLMQEHYDGLSRDSFERDLMEKKGLLAIVDDEEGILGFSTFQFIDLIFKGQKVRTLYSGDTIVHKKIWGTRLPLELLCELFFRMMDSEKGSRLYWFLLAGGVRTYLLLPLLFKKFHPFHGTNVGTKVEEPSDTLLYEKELLDYMAHMKFADFFDEENGIVRISPRNYHLKKEYQGISEARLKNPNVKFYIERNPGHSTGDELACITEISMENLTPVARRFGRSR